MNRNELEDPCSDCYEEMCWDEWKCEACGGTGWWPGMMIGGEPNFYGLGSPAGGLHCRACGGSGTIIDNVCEYYEEG